MQEQNGKDLNIPTVDIRKYAFSPPGPMGWSFQEYEKLLENPDQFLNQESQFTKLLNSLNDTELIELPSNTNPINVPKTNEANSLSPDLTPSENNEHSQIVQEIEEESTIIANEESSNEEGLVNIDGDKQEKEDLEQLVTIGEEIHTEEDVEELVNIEEEINTEEDVEELVNIEEEINTEEDVEELVSIKEEVHTEENVEELVSIKEEVHTEEDVDELVSIEEEVHTEEDVDELVSIEEEVHTEEDVEELVSIKEEINGEEHEEKLGNLKKYINQEEVNIEDVEKEISDIILLGIKEKLKRKKKKGNNILFL